jgi:guanyl-specific ribonuclease Sa
MDRKYEEQIDQVNPNGDDKPSLEDETEDTSSEHNDTDTSDVDNGANKLQTPDVKHEKEGFKKGLIIVLGTVALASAITAAVVFGGGNKPAGATSSSQPTSSMSSKPNTESSSETSSELKVEVPSVASLEIPAGGTPEQTLTAIFSRLNDLLNVGKSEDVFNDYYNNRFKTTSTEYATKYVASFVDNNLRALCGDNYQNNTDIPFWLNDAPKLAASHLDLWLSSEQIKKENHTVTATGSAAVIPVFQYNTAMESYESTASQNDFTVKVSETDNVSTIWPNGNFGSNNATDVFNVELANEKDDSGNEVVHITKFTFISQQNS